MAASVYDGLVRIKEFREDKAERTVVRQRAAVTRAEEECVRAQTRLSDWRDHARAHEHSLYNGLCKRVVRLADIEDVQQEVAQLKRGEAEREQVLREAETGRETQQHKLEADRVVLRAANRVKEKFVELARDHAAELRLAFERAQDAELDEVAELRPVARQPEPMEEPS